MQLNSKEALERLLEMAIENGLWKSGLVEDLENTIKQDLDRLEKLEKENEKLKCKNHDLLDEKLEIVLNNYNQSMGIVELMRIFIEFKKVIKILKDKNVDIYELLKSKNIVDYNNLTWSRYDFGGDELTQEEYDLLKEVLEND